MKDIIIVAGVITALIVSITVFEATIALHNISKSLDDISTSLKHTNTQISEFRYIMSDKCRELNLAIGDVNNTISDVYDSMFTNASVSIIRDDVHLMDDAERGCCLEPNSK